MKTFKRVSFGFVPTGFTNNAMSNAEQILLSYVRSTQSDFNVLTDVESAIEVVEIAKRYFGDNFRDWLIANYSNGSGSRATFCNSVVNWVNKKVSGKAVITEIKRDLNRLNYLDEYQSQSQSNLIVNNNSDCLYHNTRFDTIEKRHFYSLVALLGPELLAHLCLSISGIRLATV